MPRTASTQRQIVRDFGTCLSFNGTTSGILTSNSASLSPSNYPQAFTVSAWVKISALGVDMAIAQKQEFGAGRREWQFVRLANNKLRLLLWISGSPPSTSSTADVPINTWTFVTGTYDGVNIKVYINGIQAGVTPQTGNIDSQAAAFGIGQMDAATFLKGLIDDVRIYGEALNATQILNLYYGNEPSTLNLKLQYKLDEGSGTTTIDSSGNSNTGTITAATYSSDVFIKPRTVAGRRQVVRNFGTCLRYASNSDLVDMTSPLSLTNTFTMYLWFNRQDDNPNWLIGSSSGTAKVGFTGGVSNINIFVRPVNSGSSVSGDIGYTLDKNNKWNFICITRDSSNVVKVSLNGGGFVTLGTVSGTTTWNRVGRDNASDSFQGLLDDLVFTSSEVTLNDVQEAYYTSVYAGSKVLYYKFDEGSGTSAADSSGNANTGTITGATYSTDVFIKPRTAA